MSKIINSESLRSPIVIVSGHVDAGKTSLLDSIRKRVSSKSSSIAGSEAGGITQQNSTNYFPLEQLKKTVDIKGKYEIKATYPGLLAVDTPGHEAFYTFRQKGASLCDIAIVVIDMIEGVLPQTKEVLSMLKENKVPFVIALTKMDRLPGWLSHQGKSLRKTLKKQSKSTITHLYSKMNDIKYQLSIEEVEADFYFDNKKPEKVYSMVPVNSLKDEGISDLLAVMIYLTSNWMTKKLIIKNKFKSVILDSFKDSKMGWIIDLMIVNGSLKIGDELVIPKFSGSISTKVRNIFIDTKPVEECTGACSCRIIAKDLNNSIAGGKVYLVKDNLEELLEKSNNERESLMSSFDISECGIVVIADTLGAMDAFNYLLKKEEIPVKHFIIERPTEKTLERYSELLKKEENYYQTILYFGAPLPKEMVKKSFVKVIQDEVIYRLIEKYQDFEKESKGNIHQFLKETHQAVLPAEMSILKEHIYMVGGANNLLFGVKVKSGNLYVGMPLALVNKEKRSLGIILGIQKDGKDVIEAKEGEEVCLRLDNPNHLMYSRHFDDKDTLYSEQSRDSIENLKKYFKDKLVKSDWILVIKQKKIFGID